MTADEAREKFLGKVFLVRPECLAGRPSRREEHPDWSADSGAMERCTEIREYGNYLLVMGEYRRGYFDSRCIPLEEYLQTLP